jgi:hypothetical protein
MIPRIPASAGIPRNSHSRDFLTQKQRHMRTLHEIAGEIRRDWKKPYFGAVPYLEALECLESPNANFGCDSGREIVLYFLSNATTWKGETARRIKAELKEALK